MGTVIRFPERHGRPSAVAGSGVSSFARASKVISEMPRSDASRASASQWVEGMPRLRQMLTVDGAKERHAATALVPPSESMTESHVIMIENIVCSMQTCQEFATRQPTLDTKYDAIGFMIDPRETIVWRLEGLKQAYLPPEATDQDFARAIGLDKSTYSSIKKCDRNLSFETGCYIKEKWGISLDWLFYGDLQQSAIQIMANIGRKPTVEPPRTTQKQAPPPAAKRKAGAK